MSVAELQNIAEAKDVIPDRPVTRIKNGHSIQPLIFSKN